MIILAWSAAILFNVAWFPQMYKTWKTKSVNDLAVDTFVLPCLASLCGAIYSLSINNWVLFGGYLVTTLCTLTLVGMYWYYQI